MIADINNHLTSIISEKAVLGSNTVAPTVLLMKMLK